MAKTTPHIERWSAVAVLERAKKLVLAGGRDFGGGTGSTVYLVGLPKLAVEATAALPCAVRALAAGAELVLAGGEDGVVRALDATGAVRGEAVVEKGRAVQALARHPLEETYAAITAGGQVARIALGEKAGAASVEVRAQALGALPGAVCFSASGDRIVVGREDGQVEVWSSALDGQPRVLAVGEAAITGLALLPDGRIGATGADGSLLTFFLEGAPEPDLRSGDHGHARAARGLIVGPELFAPSGAEVPRRAFTFGDDGALKAWPLDSRRRPKTLDLGLGALVAAVHVRGKERGKPEDRGGLLVLVSSARGWATVALGADGELTETVEKVGSELDRLEAALVHSDHATRKKAIEALGAIPEDESRVLLERALADDKKPEHRALAASLIEKRGWKKSRAALEKALGDASGPVAAAAFAALWAIEPDQKHTVVAAALAHGADELRAKAVRELTALAGTSPLVLTMVGERLADPSPDVRIAALDVAFAIERSPLEAARLVQRKGAPDARAEALVRLGLTRSTAPEAVATIEGALDDADATVRAAAYVIGILARPRLRRAMAGKSEALDRTLAALESRGAFAPEGDAGEGEVTEADKATLFAALGARSPDAALRGATTLVALGDRRVIGAILGLSREPEEAVRLAAVGALATAVKTMPDDDRARARLDWLLDDTSALVRAGAFDVLLQLAGADVVGLVERALRSAHADVRARALGKLVALPRDARTEALVGDALDDEAAEVRNEAQKALWAWHAKSLRPALERAARCRHADLRARVVRDLAREKGDWARALLLELVADPVAAVGLEAYAKLTDDDTDKKRSDVHLKALGSPRAEVRIKGAQGAARASGDALRSALRARVEDDDERVAVRALESLDALAGYDEAAFAFAFSSPSYDLRVRAGELGGLRRDRRVAEPLQALLSIKKGYLHRPTEELRARAARALADVGDPSTTSFFTALLDDENPLVREMGARGLATAVRLGAEGPLVAALAHPDLPVRSWAAEGLARLGDVRALPVLAGTQRHEHAPIRRGALIGLVALGADGVQGILQGLSDPERTIQDLVFAVVVARDVAQARAGLAPDLLVSALSAAHPEIRFAAARALEARLAREPLEAFALELVGPRKPDDSDEEKKWPKAEARGPLLQVLVDLLSSDDPERRYAAVQVLALRPTPEAFWREVQRLAGPKKAGSAVVPHTNFTTEARQTRKKDWIRRLFSGGAPAPSTTESPTARVLSVLRTVGSPRPTPAPPLESAAARMVEVVFGTYAALVRQAPPRGDADETHRVRRDSLSRLGALAHDPRIGADVVRTIAERGLSDPSALVRKQALSVVEALSPAGSLAPRERALAAGATDLGRQAIDALVEAHARGTAGARELIVGALSARSREVRMHALLRLPRVFPVGSLEPWVLALASPYADVREDVVDRLGDANDPRVFEALVSALASDDTSLRTKAASLLARRGDVRAVDVLGAALASDEYGVAEDAIEALVALARAESVKTGRPLAPNEASSRVARALATRAVALGGDGDRAPLLEAYAQVADPAGDALLLEALARTGGPEQPQDGPALLDALWGSARRAGAEPHRLPGGLTLPALETARVLAAAEVAGKNGSDTLRAHLATRLGDVAAGEVEPLLGVLARDRSPAVRSAAVAALSTRVERFGEATLAPLEVVLRAGRRELVLDAASGLALRGRREAFQPLMLVLKAGEPAERGRAALALGTLGDPRAIDALLELLEPDEAEATPEDLALIPDAAEALARMSARSGGEHAAAWNRVRERVALLLREAPDPVRQRVLSGLRRAGGATSRGSIEALAGDRMETVAVRRAAATELGLLGDPAAEATLAELLTDGDEPLAVEGLAALLLLFPRDRTRVMVHALRSPHSDVSEPAASELARNGDGEALSARLGDIEQPAVRQRLVLGLIRRGVADPAATVKLFDAEAPGLRRDAALLAVSLGAQPAVVAGIEKLLAAGAARWASAASSAGRGDAKAEAEAWAYAWWAARVTGASASDAAIEAGLEARAPAAVREAALAWVSAKKPARSAERARARLGDREATVRRAAGQAAAVAGGAALPAEAWDVGMAVPIAGALGRAAASTPAGAELVALSSLDRADAGVLLAIAGDASLRERVERQVAIAALARFVGRADVRAALEALTRAAAEPVAVRKAAFRALKRLDRAEALLAKAGDQDRGKAVYASGGGGGGSYEDDEDSGDDDDDDYGGDDDDDGSGDDDDDSDGDDDDDDSDDSDDDGDSDDDDGDDDDDSDDSDDEDSDDDDSDDEDDEDD